MLSFKSQFSTFKKSLWILVLVFCTGLVVPFSVFSEERAQGLPSETVEFITYGHELDQQPGTYTYTVSWQSIPAATVTVDVAREGTQYRIQAKVKTYSGIDIFYRLRYEATGVISAVDYSPVETTIYQRENSRIKNTRIRFHDTGIVEAVRSKKGSKPEVQHLKPDHQLFDPFSAAFLARSLSWKEGQSRTFHTLTGKTQYVITLTAKKRTTMRHNGEEKTVWEIQPAVRKKESSKPHKKLKKASIYITDDSARDILLIKSSVFIGSVKTKLKGFKPDSAADNAQFARTKKKDTQLSKKKS